MSRVYRIIPDGVSYNTVYQDVNFPCQACGVIVEKISYSERTGIATWICPELHHSMEKIGV